MRCGDRQNGAPADKNDLEGRASRQVSCQPRVMMRAQDDQVHAILAHVFDDSFAHVARFHEGSRLSEKSVPNTIEENMRS